MGNTCATTTQKKTVMVPSRVIHVQVPKKNFLERNSRTNSVVTALISTATHKADYHSRPNSGDKPISGEGDDEIKTTTTLRPLTLKYDLGELGIGEYYLEAELAALIDKLPEPKKKKTLKNSVKWDRAVVQQRVKVPQISHEDSLYTYMDLCLQEFVATKPKSYEKMVLKGIPPRYRWSAWKNHVEIEKYYQKDLYEKLKGLSSLSEHDIKKDLHRTFPNEPYFSAEKYEKIGQEHLLNVLKAVSQYLPNIGYAQSMNFLVAFLLMVSGGNEVETFWMFVTMARDPKFLLMGLFEKGFPLLDFYTFIFYELLETEMPALHEHLKQQQLPDPLWLYKWFLTVFLYSLPEKYVVRIWDFVMIRELFSPIQVALGLAKFLEKDMMMLDTMGMDMLFKFLKKEPPQPQNISLRERNETEQNGENSTLEKKGTIILNHLTDPENYSIPHGHNETSEIHYNFKELDIEEILEYADKVPLSLEKIAYYTSQYTIKTGKKLPNLYEGYFNECHVVYNNSDRLYEFQKEVNFHILRSGLFTETTNSKEMKNEVVVDVLDEEEDISVLRITNIN